MTTTSRREFLKQAGTLSACVCCFGALNVLDSCSTTKGIAGSETNDMVSVPASSFNDKNYLVVQTKKYEEPIFVAKQPDGSFMALSMKCTHKGCTVKVPEENTNKMVCPCHGSQFSTQGNVLKGPATQPLPSFNVTTESQLVIVHFN